MGRQKYVAFTSHKIVEETVIYAHSKAEVANIAMQRMKKKGFIEPSVDEIVSMEEETALRQNVERMVGRTSGIGAARRG